MKKILSAIAIALVLAGSTPPKAEAATNKAKLIGGWGLVGLGAILMYDGFHQVDISAPSATIDGVVTYDNWAPDWYDVYYDGFVTNTGNTTITRVDFDIEQWDGTYPYYWLYTSSVSFTTSTPPLQSMLWSWTEYNVYSYYGIGPAYFQNATFKYIKKTKTHSVGEGIFGIAAVVGGAYLIATAKKPHHYAKVLSDNNIELSLGNQDRALTFMASKKL